MVTLIVVGGIALIGTMLWTLAATPKARMALVVTAILAVACVTYAYFVATSPIPAYQPGDIVRVTEGSYSGREARVIDISTATARKLYSLRFRNGDEIKLHGDSLTPVKVAQDLEEHRKGNPVGLVVVLVLGFIFIGGGAIYCYAVSQIKG